MPLASGCAEPNPIPYNVAAIITPIKPFEIVKTTIAKIVIHNAGSIMNTSPYLSNSFPEIGLTIVNAIAYTRKKVPGFT